MYRAAMRAIWSKLAEEKRIMALDQLEISTPPRVSQIKKILVDLEISSAVLVLPEKNEALNLASRNLNNLNIQTISSLNPSALVNAEKVVITVDTVTSLEKKLS